MICWTIVVAAGSGARFGAVKQFEDLGGKRIIDHSLATARAASDGVVVVVGLDSFASVAATLDADFVVRGGTTRAASVRAGLAAVPVEVDVILVHDAVRPFAGEDLYASVIAAIENGADAAIPAIPVVDTIKRRNVDPETGLVTVKETVDRSELMAAQTPQGFRADVLRKVHGAEPEASDDAGLIEGNGGKVVLVPGDAINFKITLPQDLAYARALVQA